MIPVLPHAINRGALVSLPAVLFDFADKFMVLVEMCHHLTES